MSTVVIVGAGTGELKNQNILNGFTDVHMFEPDAEAFRGLYTKFRASDHVHVMPFAVDIGDNQEPLFHYPEGQSTLQPSWGMPQPPFRLVWTMRLDTFMNLYSIEEIDCLHIDAPFREEMVLESLGNEANRVLSGRVVAYPSEFADEGAVPTWLVEHGFHIQRHQPNGPEKPEFAFWRR
jgi:FkbM family methyltransferase